MSKQSNQRYRKEKEDEQQKKANIESSASGTNSNRQVQDKLNREFDSPTNSKGK